MRTFTKLELSVATGFSAILIATAALIASTPAHAETTTYTYEETTIYRSSNYDQANYNKTYTYDTGVYRTNSVIGNRTKGLRPESTDKIYSQNCLEASGCVYYSGAMWNNNN